MTMLNTRNGYTILTQNHISQDSFNENDVVFVCRSLEPEVSESAQGRFTTHWRRTAYTNRTTGLRGYEYALTFHNGTIAGEIHGNRNHMSVYTILSDDGIFTIRVVWETPLYMTRVFIDRFDSI